MPHSEVEATKATSARKTRTTTTKQEVKKSPRSRSSEKIAEVENSKPIIPPQAQAVPTVATSVTNEKLAANLPVVSAQKNELILHLSESLLKKLIATAAHEGISREDLASELIAEGIVLRAFEIAERRQAMKFNVGGHAGGQSQQNGNHHRQNQGQKPNFRNGDNNSRHRRPGGNGGGIPRRPANYNNLFDDKASFMEYVRNQEKAQR
ncbi:MAG: hypothetical protein KBD78_09795 [Oligoflexales bacterium]|nr:hypothetical protein [Oligoflexales bacterium]